MEDLTKIDERIKVMIDRYSTTKDKREAWSKYMAAWRYIASRKSIIGEEGYRKWHDKLYSVMAKKLTNNNIN